MAVALALYRKYRPATFAEVVGQEHVTNPLRKALASGRINHAYLFSGPRGCGKTSSARILARSLNCVQGPTPDPCGVCPSCVALAPEGPGSLDVVELDAASHGGVDDTRELRDRAFYMPAESRYRVFIIDEAHMVTNQGFNALLKIVEEPPEHLVFIFATTEPEKVLPTIRSRTHHYPFHLLPPAVLRGLLEKLCGEEGVAVESAVYPLVVKAGAGSARDSLSVMDQLLAGAGPEGVTYANAVGLLGVTDAALLDEMVEALAASDAASVFGAVERVAEAGHDPRRFGMDLLQRLRDLVILQAVPDAADKGLVDAPADQLAAMVAQATRLPTATLTRFAEIVHTGLTDMRGTTSPRLVLELLSARMLLPAASLEDSALLQRLERVERRLDIAAEHGGSGAGAASGAGARSGAATSGAAARSAVGPDAGVPNRTVPAASPAAPRAGAAPGRGGGTTSGAAPAVAAATPMPDPGAASAAVSAEPAGGSPAAARAGAPDLGLPAPPVLSSARGAAKSSGPTLAEATPDTAPAATETIGSSGAAFTEQSVADRFSPAAEEPEAADTGTPAALPTTDAAPATKEASEPPAAGSIAASVGVTDVRRLWPQILESVKSQNRRAHALLESAAVTVVSVEAGVLLLSTQFPALARMVSESRNANLVQVALRDILGVDWRIRCVEAGSDGPAVGGPTGAVQPGGSHTGSPEFAGRAGADTQSKPRDTRTAGRPAAGAAGGGAESGRRGGGRPSNGTDGSGHRGGAEHPPDEEPDRAAAAEPDEEFNPYSEIDPDADPADTPSYEVHDPSKIAIAILTAKLGARPLDDAADQ